jgi:hypothetical protein
MLSPISSDFFLKKKVPQGKVTQNSVRRGRGGVSSTDVRKKGTRMPFWFGSFWERAFEMSFHHKNIPAYYASKTSDIRSLTYNSHRSVERYVHRILVLRLLVKWPLWRLRREGEDNSNMGFWRIECEIAVSDHT